MAGQATEIGGISVSISANTTKLDQAIEHANTALASLSSNTTVTISATANIPSAKAAAKQLRDELLSERKKLATDPLSIRFKFDSSRGAIRQARDSLSKGLIEQGGIPVKLVAMKNAAKMLIESLGPEPIVPVAFVWSGKWAEGHAPTVDVNIRGGGDQGTGGAAAGGGGGGGTSGGGGAAAGDETPAVKRAREKQERADQRARDKQERADAKAAAAAERAAGIAERARLREEAKANRAAARDQARADRAAAREARPAAGTTPRPATGTTNWAEAHRGTTIAHRTANAVMADAVSKGHATDYDDARRQLEAAGATVKGGTRSAASPAATAPISEEQQMRKDFAEYHAGEAAAKPSLAAGPRAAAVTQKTCRACGENYDPRGGGWNRHQQSPEHKNVVAGKGMAARSEPTSRVRAGETLHYNIPADASPQEQQQASVLSSRGIYPKGSTAMEQQRAGEVESREMPTAGRMFAKYTEAGGDVRGARRGQLGPRKGFEKQFEEAFPGFGQQRSVLSRRQIREEVGLSAQRRRDQRRAELLQPYAYAGAEFTDPSRVDRASRLYKMILEKAGVDLGEILPPSEEFLGIREKYTPKFAEGQAEPVGYDIEYPEEFKGKIQILQDMVNEGLELSKREELSPEEIQKIHEKYPDDEGFAKAITKARESKPEGSEAGLGEAITAGYDIRREMMRSIGGRAVASAEKRAGRRAERGEEVAPDAVIKAVSKGSRRVKRVAGQGRRVAQNIRNVEDLGILAVQGNIELAKATPRVRAEKAEASEIAAGAQETRKFNEDLGISPNAPIQTTAREPIAKLRDALKLIQARINVLEDRLKTTARSRKPDVLASRAQDKAAIAGIERERHSIEQQILTLTSAPEGEMTPAQESRGIRGRTSPAAAEAERRRIAAQAERSHRGGRGVSATTNETPAQTRARIKRQVAADAALLVMEPDPNAAQPPEQRMTGTTTPRPGMTLGERITSDYNMRVARAQAYIRRRKARGGAGPSGSASAGPLGFEGPFGFTTRAGITGSGRSVGTMLQFAEPPPPPSDEDLGIGTGGGATPPPPPPPPPGGGRGGGGGGGPFVCEICPERPEFNTRYNLNRHYGTARHKQNMAGAATGAAEEGAAAEPIRTRRGTRAEGRGRGRGRGNITTGTPRVAAGINIETAQPEPQPRAARARSQSIPRSAIDVAKAEDIVQNVNTQIEEFTKVSVRARQFASQVVQENPVRALSVAVGQVLVNVIGGRAGLIKTQKRIDAEASALDKAAKSYGLAQERVQLAEARITELRGGAAERFEGEAEKLQADLGTAAQPGPFREVAAERRQRAVDARTTLERSEAALSRQRVGRGLATLGVGTVGIVAGTALFQGAMAAFNLAVEQASIGFGRVYAAATNFEQKTGELTSSLADSARATGGNVESAVAGTFALAGFSDATADSIRPMIELRTQITAGTKAFEEQIDLLRAARFIEQGTTPGPGGERMDMEGVFETLGGFPIGPLNIGGQRSVTELLGNQMSQLVTEQSKTFATLRPIIDTQTPFGRLQIGTPDEATVQAATQRFDELETNLGQMVDAFNENIEKGGLSDLRLTTKPTEDEIEALGKAAEDAAKIYPEQADEIKSFVENLQSAGVGISGGVTGRNLPMMLQSVATGAVIPSAEEIARQQARPLAAQIQARQVQGELTRGTMLPAQQYLSQLARPLVPFEQTAAARTPGADQAANYDSAKASIDAAQASLKAYADEGERAAMETIRFADAATGGNLEASWTQATAAVKSYGVAIQAIELDMMWKQVNLQVAQYDEQLRVANRSLADAREFMTGIDQAGNNNLGLLERQALMYSRQSAELGFQSQELGLQSQMLGMQQQKLGMRSKELSLQTAMLSRQSQALGFQAQAMQLAQNQRQINFSVAQAGFTAPGMTPAERAARIAEAKVEAEFAQKQQDIAMEQFDIAKEIFGIEGEQLAIQFASFEIDKQQLVLQQEQIAIASKMLEISRAAYEVQQTIVDVNAAQAVEDLNNQVNLLLQARTVTIELAIDQENLTALREAQAAEMAKAQDVLSEAADIRQQIISSQVQIAALLGGSIGTYATAVMEALATAFPRIDTYIQNQLMRWANVGGGANAPTGQIAPNAGGSRYEAPGMIGEFATPTRLTVGDAGGEMVAILRNPRTFTAPGGGGGGEATYIQINVTGNTVRSDEDLDTLAVVVGRKVEEAMGRRARMLGFGPAGR